MATSADPVASALERWRSNLIDLTRRNPLLNLRPNRTSYLEITKPDWRAVYERLIQEKAWLFQLPAEPANVETVPSGAILRNSSDTKPGGLLRTMLKKGVVKSRVEDH